MNEQRVSASSQWYAGAGIALLCVFTALIYYPSLHYPFQFDDLANIIKHFNIRHYTFWQLFFTSTRWIVFWLNAIHYKISAFDPISYRAGSVATHITNGLLVFYLLQSLLARTANNSFYYVHRTLISLVSAALFLLHPVQTQTVSYVIQGELEGIAATASLALLVCFVRYATATTTLARMLFALLSGAVAFALTGTKEIAIVAPFIGLLVDWFFIAQGSWRSLKNRLFMHSALITSIVAVYVYLLKPSLFLRIFGLHYEVKNNIGNVITHDPAQMVTPYVFFISQFKVILHYLWIFIWPFNISVEYDWMVSRSFFAPDCILPFIVLVALVCIVAYALKRNPINPVCFGALWFACAVAPRSSIMPSPELLVDYKTYLASVGWLFVIACALVAAAQYVVRMLARTRYASHAPANLAVAVLCAVPLGYATYKRNLVWSSGTEFWQNVIKNAPGKARAYNNYGVELSQHQGKFAESIPYFQQAIAMDSNYADPCNNIAVAFAQLGQTDRAIEAIKRALIINPYYPEGYNNLASFCLQKKDTEQAKRALEAAIKLRPHYGKALFNLARAYVDEGQHEKAWEYFKRACTQGDMDNDLGFATYAKMSFTLQKFDDAIAGYQRAIALNPNYPGVFLELGATYQALGRHEEAINVLRTALARTPHDEHLLYTFAESLLAINQVYQALDAFNIIKKKGIVSPQLYLRIAVCYEKMGTPDQAVRTLEELVRCNMGPEVNDKAGGCIAQLKQRYNIA